MASAVVQRRRAQRMAEILDAAWQLAETEGLAALSLRDLAAAVGMRAPSLYEYFDGKDAIHDAMFAQGWETLTAELRDAPWSDDLHVLLTDRILLMLHFCAASLPRYQLMFTRAIPGWEPSPDAYQSSIDSLALMTRQLTRAGVTDPADIDLLSSVTAGLAAQQAANDPGGDRYHRLAATAARMFILHLDASADPPPPGGGSHDRTADTR